MAQAYSSPSNQIFAHQLRLEGIAVKAYLLLFFLPWKHNRVWEVISSARRRLKGWSRGMCMQFQACIVYLEGSRLFYSGWSEADLSSSLGSTCIPFQPTMTEMGWAEWKTMKEAPLWTTELQLLNRCAIQKKKKINVLTNKKPLQLLDQNKGKLVSGWWSQSKSHDKLSKRPCNFGLKRKNC